MTDPALLPSQDDEFARLEAVVRSVTDAIVTIDSRGAIDYMNPAAEALFGVRAADALGRSFAALIAEPHQQEYAGWMRDFARGQAIPALGVTREVLGRRADGATFAMELALSDLRPMVQRMLVAVARDIRARKVAEAELRQLADHDVATGLLNRRSFENEVTRHIQHAARYGSSGSVVEMDVDNFKYVNETLGPGGGDELIATIAGLIKGRVRVTDTLGRLGGDKIGLLLPGAGRAKATTVAEELLELIREHSFAIGRQPVRVTVSAGLSAVEDRPITGVELIAEAETAMYEAKEEGRDRVVEYDPESRETPDSKRMWSERVRQATERGLFVLVSQPIVEIASGQITQHELLLRMRGEDGELVPPGVFLSTAERFGLIGSVDRWVTQQAVRLVGAHAARGKRLLLEVNLSGKTLTDTNFSAQLQRELTRSGIDPSQLIFEVTETAAVADIDRARKMAEELTGIGCSFALDDFGSGFASFYYLKHLPIRYLKIDGEFVKKLPHNATDQLIVKALVDVCRGLGIKTIGEFVEDEQTLEMLRGLGVDYAQGYFLGHPHPVADLVAAAEAPPAPT